MSNTYTQFPHNRPQKDKFLMVFDIPPILKTLDKSITETNAGNNSSIITDSVQFTVYGSLVPSIIVPGVKARHAGSTLYVSSHSKDAPPPVHVNFDIDNLYNNYWVIYQWLNLLHNEKTGRYNDREIIIDDTFSDYQTDLTLYGLDEYNKKRIQFVYKKAFPTSVDQIEYSHREVGQLICGFTFLYSQMHVSLLRE